MNDNRNYKYTETSQTVRNEYKIIQSWIPRGSKVIDLGCGDGSLLKLLQQNDVQGEGIDVAATAVKSAKRKGIKIKQGIIDTKLNYKENQFDFAICTVTLQMVMYPEKVIGEMKRIAKELIISIPNFGFIANRIDLFFFGRMPRPMLFGYNWFSTGHIHQLSLSDFERFCKDHNLVIIKRVPFVFGQLGKLPSIILSKSPNLWASSALYHLKKGS